MRPLPRPRRTVAAAVAVLIACLAAVPAVANAAPATLSQEAVLGGPGHAQLYASGLETYKRSIIVADTGNNQIASFTSSGVQRWRVGSFGNQAGMFSNPRDVGVDAAGRIYVADTGNRRIVKLSPEGAWLGSWKGPVGDPIATPMGVTVRQDLVYVADAAAKVVRVFDTGGTQLRVIRSSGECVMAPLRDADADTRGNVYVANYTANNVLKFSADGECLASWGVKGSTPGAFKNPYGIRLGPDPVLGTQTVYVADSNNQRIQEFRRDGTHVASIGRPGKYPEPGTFDSLRRVAVTREGDVWGADLWQGRLERFDRSAGGYDYARTIGTGPAPLERDHVFNEVRGVETAEDGTLWATDSVNQRIVRLRDDGAILGACGARGWGIGEFNWPRDVAVDPQSGTLWVADTKQSRLQVLRPDCGGVAILSSFGNGPANMNWPHSIEIRGSDGIAIVADTNNHRLSFWDVATRRHVAVYDGGSQNSFERPRGVWVDDRTGHVWVADSVHNRVVELAVTPGADDVTWLRSVDCGCLLRPEGVATDERGHIFVADTGHDRLVELDPKGELVAAVGGAEAPSSVTVGADGRVYLSDTYHDRILVFTTSTSAA